MLQSSEHVVFFALGNDLNSFLQTGHTFQLLPVYILEQSGQNCGVFCPFNSISNFSPHPGQTALTVSSIFGPLDTHPQETVCFSGHRTKSLPTESIHGVHPFVLIQILLFFLIEEALDDGYRYFINGGAEGVDLWAATYIMHKMQAGRTDLHLISALPAPRHIQLYHGETRFRLYRILEQSEAVIYVSRQRKRNYNLIRNAYMTDHATRLLAVVKNDKSGTGNTIRQAQEKQLALRILVSGF